MILFIFLIFSIFSNLQASDLFLFGGGKRSQEAFSQMVELKRNPKILLILWPTSYPEETEQSLREDFLRAGAQANSILVAPTPMEVDREHGPFLEQLKQSDIVFISGGDQNVMLDLLDKHPGLKSAIREASEKGVIFAGTSAGTALMSKMAICGGPNDKTISSETTCLREGLGLLPEKIIVDQHFVRRSRYNRLLSALIFSSRLKMAYGINEDSAAHIKNGRLVRNWGQVLKFKKKREKITLSFY